MIELTELIYQVDSYVREFDAIVKEVRGRGVVLNKTAFNPRSGGLPPDTGYIVKASREYRVIDVEIEKESANVVHVIDSEHDLSPGDIVRGVIDWSKRYRVMRLHTAAHILSAIMYLRHGALITGGNIYEEYAYDDYSLESFDLNIFKEAIREANEVVKKGVDVKIYWLSREEALRIPGVIKLASKMPPSIATLRIVEIPGVDIQADGGPHVRNTQEIGEIVFVKAENKGKKRKRLYYSVRP